MTSTQKHFYIYAIGMSLVMLLLAYFHQQVNPLLAYQREAILDGQLWRLFTAHFVHLNLNHFLLDAAGFLLVCWIFDDVLNSKLLAIWALVSAPLSSLLFLFDGQLHGYVGISGILHGWLVIALIRGLRTNPWLHGIALTLVAAKLAYEQSPFYDAGYLADLIHGQVYATAHLCGALIGVLIGLASLYIAPPDSHNH